MTATSPAYFANPLSINNIPASFVIVHVLTLVSAGARLRKRAARLREQAPSPGGEFVAAEEPSLISPDLESNSQLLAHQADSGFV